MITENVIHVKLIRSIITEIRLYVRLIAGFLIDLIFLQESVIIIRSKRIEVLIPE